MEGEAGEFQDWEVLVNSSDSDEKTRDLDGIESDSGGMIRSDYFSLDSMGKYSRRTVPEGDLSEEGDVESDNPSWIDPESVEQYPTMERGEFWSDSSSDRCDDRKFNDFDVKNESGFLENAKNQLGLEGIGEIGPENKKPEKFWSDSSVIGPNQMKFVEIEKDNEMGIGDYANSQEGSSEVLVEEKAEEVVSEVIKSGGEEEEEKRTVVWWKVPMELLKFCVFRFSPVWTFSVAAAVMGLVMLGRRLYKMKRKSRSLQLKVTLDDTKVSQFMRRAARLNEAFSVVKRVPVIRPSLPAAGVTPWPVMSLR